MPPSKESAGLGWKAFFGLLMLMQIVGVGVMWRTYDAVSALTEAKVKNEVMVNNVILPTLARHDNAIERLKAKAGVSSE